MTEKKPSPIEAFILAKSEMTKPAFNKVNPHFKNKYADLASVKNATAPALESHKFSYGETFGFEGVYWGLIARITYLDGTLVADGFYPIDADMKDQQKGSAITYGRRYLRSSLCDVVADDDDDGNAAQEHVQKSKSSGPLGITALKQKIRDFSVELAECEDSTQIDGMMKDYKTVFDQAERDLFEWFDGAMQGIEKRKTELKDK
jgi:hypothetical protein